MSRKTRPCSTSPAVSALVLLSLLFLSAQPHHAHSRLLSVPSKLLLQQSSSDDLDARGGGGDSSGNGVHEFQPPEPSHVVVVDFTPCRGWETSSSSSPSANCPPPRPDFSDGPGFATSKRLTPTGPDPLHN